MKVSNCFLIMGKLGIIHDTGSEKITILLFWRIRDKTLIMGLYMDEVINVSLNVKFGTGL